MKIYQFPFTKPHVTNSGRIPILNWRYIDRKHATAQDEKEQDWKNGTNVIYCLDNYISIEKVCQRPTVALM